ncbi:BREX-2 system ATPase PglY [Nocardia sp. CA-135953]|uniref:BREX-2 system ATPase PglY n=1 Tax=Nocardia sp. CA-135953 TaxID=3239978 RepID=UPI003D9849BC
MDQRPLLRDLIEIKEHIAGSDYVLTLADAVTEAGSTKAVEDYVLTERLLGNFDEALALIKSALDGNTSKPAFLHGSFGAGKSHFMAVLYALLSGNPVARSRSEFDPLLTKHEWLLSDGKKFLMVPYHMIDAKAMEQRVLGGYVDFVRKRHPEAIIPPVYRTDALFINLRSLRTTMGEQPFLAALNGDNAGDGDDEWGESTAFWTTEKLGTALAAAEAHDGSPLNLVNPTTGPELRAKLVHDAGTTLLPGFTQQAAEDETGFISLDAGLSVIASHAKSLGYDGIILFLDELILWLASLIHDEKRVAREASKITNFREGGDARRDIPIISFIARQRDLRELVGEKLAGAAESAIQDALNHASGRFDLISLEDRNLPQIAHARLLKPRDDAAAAQFDAAFDRTRKLGPKVWDVLLGSDESTTGADEASFRLSYPFSPAFLDTLVHISAALQRSRTGLKLMGQLLADHRNELRLGDLVPLGDLYEQLTRGGDRPFVADKKVLFDAADKLYKTRLRPYLLSTCEVTEDDIDAYVNRRDTITDAKLLGNCKKFVGQNRLACTVLLAALAPSVPALRDLTIRRLGALNYGSITTMIPGREEGVIKDMIGEWAGRFPEIKPTGTDANPGVRLELSGVDVESVIANAQVNDNPANRLALARDLLAEEFGLDRANGRFDADELRFVWRGSNRIAEVVFGNVSDDDALPNHDLQPAYEGRWRIVIDLPYDEGAHTPIEDADRIRRLKEEQGNNHPNTVAWLPTHLTKPRWEDFRRLLVVTKALADPYRFDTQYAQHLNPDNRASAKQLLESQREVLRQRVLATFKQAYGLAERKPEDVTDDLGELFHPLPDIDSLTVSIGQSLHDAIRNLAGKLLAHQFPEHPNLDPEGTGVAVKPVEAKTVLAQVKGAAEARDGRFEVPAKERALMRRIAEPLGLGQQKEAYFELSRRWADHFRRAAQNNGSTGDLSVISLGDWIDLPQPRGLEPHIANLVIASFAEMDDRIWVRGGVHIDTPELTKIQAGYALRTQPLPTESDFDAARNRFEVIFGDKAPTLLRGGPVQQFARQINSAATKYQDSAARLVEQLQKRADFLELDGSDAGERLALARRSLELLSTLATVGTGGSAGAKKAVEALARFDLAEVNADRYGTSIKSADQVTTALANAAWHSLEDATLLGAEGAALLDSLRTAAQADQRSADLIEALRSAGAKVTVLNRRILEQRRKEQAAAATPAAEPAPPPPSAGDVNLNTDTSTPPLPDIPVSVRTGRRANKYTTTAGAAVAEFSADLAELAALEPDASIEILWRVVE